jgi:hypothetical protein
LKSTSRDYLLVGILLALFCARVWNLGITHTDDAVWALRAWDTPGNIFFNEPVGDWARRQGRFWAFVSGALMLHTLEWQGTVYGELLRLGSYAGFFVAFRAAVRAYCGTRIAVLAAVLNIGLAMVRWDGSILTTYPLITWVAGIAFCLALIAGRAYVAGGRRALVVVAGLLLYFSFMNNEGVTAAFMLLALLAARYARTQLLAEGIEGAAARGVRFFAVAALACAAYAALYFGWRLAHPSQYVGNQVAWLGVRSFLTTWWHFSTGGSVLHDLAWPYHVTYMDKQDLVPHERVYVIGNHVREVLASPTAWVSGLLCGWVAFSALRSSSASPQPVAARSGMIAGLVIATVIVAPVAITALYQVWVMEKGVRSYSHTPLAHFGWSLFLAALLSRVAAGPQRTHAVPRACIAVLLGVLAALASRANDGIVNDMRPEAGRWRVLESVLAANHAGPHAQMLLIPRFDSASWYGWVPFGYWWQYGAARWDEGATRTYTERPLPPSPTWDATLVDYAWDGRRRGFVGLMGPLATSPTRSVAQPITVFDEAGAGDAQGLSLVYPAADRKALHRSLLPAPQAMHGGTSIHVLDVGDVPWVRLEREDGGRYRALVELDLQSGKVRNATWLAGPPS